MQHHQLLFEKSCVSLSRVTKCPYAGRLSGAGLTITLPSNRRSGFALDDFDRIGTADRFRASFNRP